MGMGEPLLNYRNLVTALTVMMEGLSMSRTRFTVSTAGIVPNILKLKKDVDCALALSLHAPTNELRSVSSSLCTDRGKEREQESLILPQKLMPINDSYPLSNVMEAVRKYAEADGKLSM